MPRRWLIALVLVFTGVPLGDVAVSGRKDRKFYRVFVFRCVRLVSRLMTWGLRFDRLLFPKAVIQVGEIRQR